MIDDNTLQAQVCFKLRGPVHVLTKTDELEINVSNTLFIPAQ